MLQEHGVEKAVFHCYSGKVKLAKRIAEYEAGQYYISIPSAVHRIESFQNLAKQVPLERLLTETDAPYMGPIKGERNEPATVATHGVAAIAAARGMDESAVGERIMENFRTVFSVPG